MICLSPGRIAAGLVSLGLLCGLLFAAPCNSATLDQLIAGGRLEATVVVDTQGPLYERAPLIIAVEIATPRWFSRGTRVRDFRIEQAIVRPVSAFADNQSQSRGEQTWSIQRWRFRIYPQRAGTLTLPSIRVFASINSESYGIVEGELRLNATALRIETPPGVNPESDWIATSALTITDNWRGQQDSYQPGDAITRTRRFRVVDAPAMLLEEKQLEEIPGLSLYRAPAKIQDETSRGELIGTREESLVITVEQPGDFTIPGADFAWFNTDTGEMQTIVLEPYSFTVEDTAESEPTSALSNTESSTAARTGRALLILAAAISVAVVLAWSLRRALRLKVIKNLIRRCASMWRYKAAARAYRHAAQARDSAGCLGVLYERLCIDSTCRSLASAVRRDRTGQSTLRRLLAHGYAPDHEEDFPDSESLRRLWEVIHAERVASIANAQSGRRRKGIGRIAPAVKLSINPPPTQS